MNAFEKIHTLKANGYHHARDYDASIWRKNGIWVAEAESFAKATEQAYQHYLDNLPSEDEPAQETERQKALEGDLYELVGLGLASPDLLIKESKEELKARIAELEAERDGLQLSVHGLQAKLDKQARMNINLAEENATLKKVIASREADAVSLYEENKALRQMNPKAQFLPVSRGAEYISKLEADNAAFAQIVIEAGKTVSGLKEDAKNLDASVESLRKEVASLRSFVGSPESCTLTEDEIWWLANNPHRGSSKDNMLFVYPNLTPAMLRVLERAKGISHKLKPEFDTPANRAAIAERRKALGLS